MANTEQIAILKTGVTHWNRWREKNPREQVDLSGADLGGLKLNEVNFLRTNLTGAILIKSQLEHAHLTGADLTGASLEGANLEHVNARNAVFDRVAASGANFEVSTLRGAHFRNAHLAGARFHRAYLRETDLSDADLDRAWLRFANLERARCARTNFRGADLRHASMVETDLRGANLSDVHVFGISAWSTRTDADTRQDLIVGDGAANDAPLRAHDLHTAQLLALMLDGIGVRQVFDSVTSKLVLVLGSFSPGEKPVLDALRLALLSRGYVAVTFDFERPSSRDYAETVLSLVGMSRFVIADFTNAKEVRAEVAQAHRQYRRVPIVPIVRQGEPLPVTMANSFSDQDLDLLVRYKDVDHLVETLDESVIDPAEALASRIAASIARSEAILRAPSAGPTEG
jgi:uncharacterized protein YjbI with pentapeptide repeats